MNINTLKTLSSVYKDTGPMTTTKLIEELLPQLLTLESRFGDLDARCFSPRHKLAHAYRAIGEFEQAIKLFIKNLDAKSQVLGELHKSCFECGLNANGQMHLKAIQTQA